MKFMELKNCPHCDTRVLPTSDDLCPNCRHLLHDVTGIQVEIDGGDLPQEKQGLKKDAKCPICGLINPAGTIICDCGYDFDTGSSKGCSVAHLTTLDIIICVFFPLTSLLVIDYSAFLIVLLIWSRCSSINDLIIPFGLSSIHSARPILESETSLIPANIPPPLASRAF